MKQYIPFILVAGLLTACSSSSVHRQTDTTNAVPGAQTGPAGASSSALTINGYKREAAEHISSMSHDKVFEGRPQALLRSVVVIKYVVDAQGNLLRTETMRSNHDGVTEMTALNALRAAAPFPKPASSLLRHGRLELMETWLFNNDGRFQLRTIAEPQMDQ